MLQLDSVPSASPVPRQMVLLFDLRAIKAWAHSMWLKLAVATCTCFASRSDFCGGNPSKFKFVSAIRQHAHQSLATVQPTLHGAWAPRNCPQNAPTLQGCPHLLRHGDDRFRIVLFAAYRASSSGQSTGKYPASPCTSPITSHKYFH